MALCGTGDHSYEKLAARSSDGNEQLTSHGQHVLLVLRTEFHIVHEVLDTDLVENAIGVNEEYEHVVSEVNILRVRLIDLGESHLLTVSLSSMRKTRYGKLRSAVLYVEAGRYIFGEVCDPERSESSEVQLVHLVAIEAEEDMDCLRRIVTVDHRVDGGNKDVDIFVEDWWVSMGRLLSSGLFCPLTWHYNNNLRGSFFSEDLLHLLFASKL